MAVQSIDEALTCVDLVFPVMGAEIPRNHGYALYGAISRLVPAAHENRGLGIFPIRGTPDGKGGLLLNRYSHLRARVAAGELPMLLKLAGQSLELDGRRVRVGAPRVEGLVPAATLASPLVLIKLARPPEARATSPQVTPERFLEAAGKQLAQMGLVQAEAEIPLIQNGPHAGQPRRRVLRVKDQTHAGYALIVRGLTAEESIRLQERGLGGRRLMGCGLFLGMRGKGGE